MTVPAGKIQILPLIRASREETSPFSSTSSESSDTSTPPVRRTRTGKPKVKTGCITCNSIDWEQGDPAERRAIDFFRCRTAPSVSGYFDADFRDEHNDPLALAQYNKAIKHLARLMNQPSLESVDTTLLLSVLFVCVECLRGDYQAAIKHFQSGMSIALASAGGKSINSPGSPSSSIRDKVAPFLNRLELLAILFGRDPPYEYGLEPSETVPQRFTTIMEARDSLVHIMNLSTRFIRHTKEPRYNNKISSEDIRYYSKLLASLCDWKQTLDAYLSTQQPTAHLAEAASTLEIHQIASITWLNRSLNNREDVTDTDIPLYERAVQLAETLQPTTQATTSSFLFDMEYVSPLYLVAMKCRHPLIRRRAIAVLRRCTRREGLWDSLKAAAIAERIVQIEEEGMEVLDGSVLPEERMRVHNCHIDSKPGVDPTGHSLTIFTLPDGPEGEWKSWSEVVEMRR
ncbi:hypothetical protein Q7P37_001363 [Cladosporium fusiforme]